jgi:hypothetical protein
VLRDYYSGRLGDADLEERLLRNVDEGQFRAICQNALEGLASKKLNLEMLIERRARAQERRVVPETIARFLREAAEFVPLTLKTIPSVPHAFEPARTPSILRRYEKDPDWKLPTLADRYPRCSTDREAAETEKLEWVTPGHPLFEAIRRHTHARALDVLGTGATFHSLQHESPARIDFYRARVVDGLGQVVHERLFAVEIPEDGEPRLQEPGLLGNFAPADPPAEMPAVAALPEVTTWLHEHALAPFLEETRKDRLSEVERVSAHVELSLTELLQRADEEIGRAAFHRDQDVRERAGLLADRGLGHLAVGAPHPDPVADRELDLALPLDGLLHALTLRQLEQHPLLALRHAPRPVGVVQGEALIDDEVADPDVGDAGHERLDRGPRVLGHRRGARGERGEDERQDEGVPHGCGYNAVDTPNANERSVYWGATRSVVASSRSSGTRDRSRSSCSSCSWASPS